MKKAWISIIITVVIIGLSLTDILLTAHIEEELQGSLQNLEELVDDDNIEDAIAYSEVIKSDWKKYHEILAIFITHEYLEGIDNSIVRINSSLEHDDIETFWEECACTKIMIESIKTTEYPTISNIL